MSNIIKKLDKFRSSTSFFVFNLLNGLFLICLQLRQLFSVDDFNSTFYFQMLFLTTGIFSVWVFGKLVLSNISF